VSDHERPLARRPSRDDVDDLHPDRTLRTAIRPPSVTVGESRIAL